MLVGGGARQHRFTGAGDVLQEHVALTEQGDHQQFDLRVLADDDGFDVFGDTGGEFGEGGCCHCDLLFWSRET